MRKPYTYERLKKGMDLIELIDRIYPSYDYNLLNTILFSDGYLETQKIATTIILKFLKRDGVDASMYKIPEIDTQKENIFDARQERIDSMYEMAYDMKNVCHELLKGTSWSIEGRSITDMTCEVIPEKYLAPSRPRTVDLLKEEGEVIKDRVGFWIEKYSSPPLNRILSICQEKLADIAIDQYNEYYYFNHINFYINKKIPVFLQNLQRHEKNAARKENKDILLVQRILKPLCLETKGYFPLADDYMVHLPNGLIKPKGLRKEILIYTFVEYETEEGETIYPHLYRSDAFFNLVLLDRAMEYMEHKYPHIYKNEGRKKVSA